VERNVERNSERLRHWDQKNRQRGEEQRKKEAEEEAERRRNQRNQERRWYDDVLGFLPNLDPSEFPPPSTEPTGDGEPGRRPAMGGPSPEERALVKQIKFEIDGLRTQLRKLERARDKKLEQKTKTAEAEKRYLELLETVPEDMRERAIEYAKSLFRDRITPKPRTILSLIKDAFTGGRQVYDLDRLYSAYYDSHMGRVMENEYSTSFEDSEIRRIERQISALEDLLRRRPSQQY
jgi:hypothetical protein